MAGVSDLDSIARRRRAEEKAGGAEGRSSGAEGRIPSPDDVSSAEGGAGLRNFFLKCHEIDLLLGVVSFLVVLAKIEERELLCDDGGLVPTCELLQL